jgi:hypothetical protein
MDVDWMDLARAFGRMVLAAVLAAPVAFHPMRYGKRRHRKRVRDTAKAQLSISVAGALIMAVIGNNQAGAFALFGLGALVRFRSGLKSAADAGIMFLMIGIGMAVGMRHYPVAVAAMVFVFLLVAVFEWFVPDPPEQEDDERKAT